ncbi:MAG TPA: asparagine synthase [Rhodanobacteraceae bacterium]|nr:asparagine synthase [Rhodanobacteraceae bacterium]
MLNALCVSLHGAKPGGHARAVRSLERQGLLPAGSFEWQGGALDAWASPHQTAVEHVWLRTDAGFACCVGPLWYQGCFGRAALELLLDAVGQSSEPNEFALRGNFALFLCCGSRCVLMNDAPGFVRIYASADRLFYSTSWLATCTYAGPVEVDEDAAAEYVLLGASHSDATVARGVTTLPLGQGFDLARKATYTRIGSQDWAQTGVPRSFDEAVDEGEAWLRTTFSQIAAAFPGRVRMALSGGFDSRLILAGLLASNAEPALFVYGGPATADVQVARVVAEHAGLHLEVIDKQQRCVGRAAPDMERLVHNALFFDGLPNDGIHDSGVDEETRLEQTADGWLALNGGGGEIFRNYFHLPRRAFRAVDIVRAFYRGFDAGIFRRAGALRAYESRMAASMDRVLGRATHNGGARMTREQVELLYPLFRCHYWMAVNNSVAVRHGYNMTPLLDLDTVRFACRLQLAWKSAGRLESRLIDRLHPGIAEQPSEYGFRFADGPDRRARFSEWVTCARPVFARPFISAAHRRLRRHAVAPDMLAHCRAMMPGEWRMDRMLDLHRLPGNDAFGRALAVEVVWRHLL